MSEAAVAETSAFAEYVVGDEADEDGSEYRIPVEARPTLGRTYQTVDLNLDGRNLEMLCAPFDSPATVSDPPDHVPYKEEFARGAFTGATKAPNRVLLEFEHFAPGLSGVIGRGAHFEETATDLYGRFRFLGGADADKAIELVHENVLGAASVFFAPMKYSKVGRAHVRHLQVALDRVALCRTGAYPEARVIAVRTAAALVEEVPPLPESAKVIGFDPDLRARLEAAGLEVPPTLR